MSKAEPKNTDKTKYVVLAPLSDFYWGGTEFSTTESMQIKEYKELPDLDRYKFVLSKADWSELNKVSHWIYFEQCGSEILSPAEKINAFLFALWVVRPTPAHVKYRFKFPHGVGTNQSACFSRLLDRFEWIRGQVSYNNITDDELSEVARLILPLESIYNAKKRLRNAFYLNFVGCQQTHWQAAFVCFSAVAEAILTYSRKARLTKRLAKSYACLVESTKPERDSAYQTFKRLYRIRSEIMHGRAMHLNIPDVNLEYLAEFSDLLRNLWKVVLNSTDLINVLEMDDAEREKWFLQNEHGYTPPDWSGSE